MRAHLASSCRLEGTGQRLFGITTLRLGEENESSTENVFCDAGHLLCVRTKCSTGEGPCTDTDIPGETEGTEEDSDDDKKKRIKWMCSEDDNGNYWWNDDEEIKRVWPRDDPNALESSQQIHLRETILIKQARMTRRGHTTNRGHMTNRTHMTLQALMVARKSLLTLLKARSVPEIEWTYLLRRMGLSDNEAMSLLLVLR